jgi:integrase
MNKEPVPVWYARTPAGWRYLPHTPESRAAHPNGRLMFRVYDSGKIHYFAATVIHGEVSKGGIPGSTAGLQTAIGRLLKTKQGAHDIQSRVQAYIANREAHNKLEAAENSRVVLREFTEMFPALRSVKAIHPENLTQFCMKLRESGLSDRTVSNKYNRLRSFLKFAGHDVKLSKDDRPKYEKTLPTAYTKQEIDALLKHADEYMRVVISVGVQLGLREQEMQFAEFSDIDREHLTFRVKSKPAYGFKVKDSEQRDVPVPSKLLAVLDKWQKKRKGASLILGIGDGHSRANGHLLRWLQRVADKAGVPDATLHKMRRTYLTMIVRSGVVDIRTAQAFAGHSDLASTMRYLKPASAAEMQSKIDSIF